jgi:hypothetical protein
VSVRAAVRPLAANLADVRVRILHARGDTICPFADAEAMHAALTGSGAAAERELIVYEDADWGGTPPPARHPGPHHLRRENVFALIGAAKRTIPSSLERLVRYRQQGHEGRWRVEPPSDPTKPLNVKLAEDGGTLTASGADAVYLVPLEDFLAKKTYRAGGLEMRTKGDMTAAMTAFKRTGDPARVHAAEIRVAETK